MLDDAIVVALYVQQQLGRCGQQSREIEGRDGHLPAGHLTGVLYKGQVILEKVQVVAVNRPGTACANVTSLREEVVRHIARAGASDPLHLGGRGGLPGTHKGSSREVQPFLSGGNAHPQRHADAGADQTRAASLQGLGRPPGHDTCLIQAHRLRPWDGYAKQPSHGDDVVGSQTVFQRWPKVPNRDG